MYVQWGRSDVVVGVFRTTYFFENRYYQAVDTKKPKELWNRLENEPDRAYHAFECYLTLPGTDRTFLEAYRQHVGNSLAVKPSDTWSRWSSQFAWQERAAAYDDHLASLRRDAYERGLEEEAERQGALVERNRNRMNEMMTLGYEESMKWLEEVGSSGMRASDVIQIMRLHMDAVKAFGVAGEHKEDEWTEEDERDLIERILPEITALEDSEEGSGEDSESDYLGESG